MSKEIVLSKITDSKIYNVGDVLNLNIQERETSDNRKIKIINMSKKKHDTINEVVEFDLDNSLILSEKDFLSLTNKTYCEGIVISYRPTILVDGLHQFLIKIK